MILLSIKGNAKCFTKSMHSLFRCAAPFDLFFNIPTTITVLCTFI